MKQCLILTLAVASGPLGCLHLQRMEAGKHRICSICINHLIIFLIILNPHHSQCQQIILIPLQVKGKGEMMTYYVDLTDDLFLVEKRRHGEDKETAGDQSKQVQSVLQHRQSVQHGGGGQQRDGGLQLWH